MCEQRKKELIKHGFFVGKRDPKRNRAFRGKFMVCDREALKEPPSDSATGAFCVVGDNLPALIVDAYNLHDGFSDAV